MALTKQTNTPNGGRMPANFIPVVSVTGDPLTPCSPAKARKLLRGKAAIKRWNKTGVFYIRLTTKTREQTPDMSLALDPGNKFSGIDISTEKYRQVCGTIEVSNKITKKIETRGAMRRNRRKRKCRRRKARFYNRTGCKYAPSVKSKADFEKRIINELCKIYPINDLCMEEVSFNHYKKKWGKHFSHVEIRKGDVREFMKSKGNYYSYKGFETAESRKEYDIKKCSAKDKHSKEAHANDSWAMNAELYGDLPIDNGCNFIYWKPNLTVKRQLHMMTTRKGGIRPNQGSTSRDGISKGSYVYSERFGNCWIQGFRTKDKRCYLMDSSKKRVGEQVINKLHLLHRSNLLFNII